MKPIWGRKEEIVHFSTHWSKKTLSRSEDSNKLLNKIQIKSQNIPSGSAVNASLWNKRSRFMIWDLTNDKINILRYNCKKNLMKNINLQNANESKFQSQTFLCFFFPIWFMLFDV